MIESAPRIAILVSGDRQSGGGGTTAETAARDILKGEVALNIGAVICNNPPGSVGVYEKFERLNVEFGLHGSDRIEVAHIGPQNYPEGKLPRGQTLTESAAICSVLEEREIDFVMMLGYMRILTGKLLDEWAWQPKYAKDPNPLYSFREGIYHPNARTGNNHPAILPLAADTHGLGAHQRAMELYRDGKITHTAMTWHLASAAVDDGPIIREIPVAIAPEDTAETLGTKVQAVEKANTAHVLEEHLILRAQHLRAA